jgi:hypothetical protein
MNTKELKSKATASELTLIEAVESAVRKELLGESTAAADLKVCQSALDTEREYRKATERNLQNLLHYVRGDEGDVPVSGAAITIRDCILGLRAELIEVREAWNSDHLEMKRRVDGVPEPQYRELEHGEAILITDEWLGDDGQWQVRESVQPGERLFLAGKPPVEGLQPPERGGHHTRHRRRVDGAPKYRILAVGEIIEDGDEYRSNVDGRWYPSCDAGEQVPSGRQYRRPVKPSTKPLATHRDLTVGDRYNRSSSHRPHRRPL